MARFEHAAPEAWTTPDHQTDESAPSPEDVSADLFDFVDDFERDEAAGRVRALGDYLARYPRAQAEVAAEYLRLTGAIDEEAGSVPPAEEAVRTNSRASGATGSCASSAQAARARSGSVATMGSGGTSP